MSQGSTEQLRGRDYVLALLWLARARAAAAASARATFVLRPGGTAGGNVYTDWASLYAAFSQVQGPRWVWIDGSLGVPLVPAGTYNVDNTVFGTYGSGPPLFANGTLNFESGATFTFTSMTIEGNLTMQSASSAPIVQMTNGSAIIMSDGCELAGSPAAAFANVPDGNQAQIYVQGNSQLGDGTNPALSTTGTGEWQVFAFNDGAITDGSISTTGTPGATVFYDASSQIGLHFSANIAGTLLDKASQVAYTPATASNWNPVPGTVAGALDQLAAPNALTQLNAAPLGPATTVSLATAATFTRALSGKFVVAARLSGTDAGDTDTIAAQLTLDGTPVGPVSKVDTGFAGATWDTSITWIVTIADTATHHAGITATGASALTVAIDQASVVVYELP